VAGCRASTAASGHQRHSSSVFCSQGSPVGVQPWHHIRQPAVTVWPHCCSGLVFISYDSYYQLFGDLCLMLLRPLFRLLSHVAWTGAIRCCVVCWRTCWGRCSLCRMLLLVCSPTHGVETTSLRCCVNSIGCRYRDEWSSRLHVWHINRLLQQHRHTYLPTFNSSLSMVVFISVCLFYRTLAVPRTRTTVGDRSFAVAGLRVWNSLPTTIRQIASYGQFRQRLKTHLFRA